MKRVVNTIVILTSGILIGGIITFQLHRVIGFSKVKNYLFDDVSKSKWNTDVFEIIEVNSSIDGKKQKVYSYQTRSDDTRPLIVSLHSWRGDYKQFDGFANQVVDLDWNYIHPDFRGPNTKHEACCSELALSDIEDAINYAIINFKVDTNNIHIIGGSGGAYAAISMYMKSKLSIASYSAWCPISDLSAWHRETKNRGLPYYENIEDCIGQSKGSIFDTLLAQLRSPMYWDVPMDKQNTTKLYIYVGSRDGIFDGKKGTVPISHSLNFYNKLVSCKINR